MVASRSLKLRVQGSETLRIAQAVLLIFAWMLVLTPAEAEPRPYGTQPLIRLSNGRPGVMVAINGYGMFPFLIDTATSHTVLTPRLRDRLRLRASGGAPMSVVTAAGRVPSEFVLIGEIATSGVIVERVNAVVMDLPASLGAVGILGADFLSNFTVDLDLERHTVTLYPERTVVQPPGFQKIAGSVNAANFIIAPGRIDGAVASFVYDSGAVLTVANQALVNQTQRFSKVIARNIQSKVVDAVEQRGGAESLNFRRLTLGPMLWSDRRVLIARMHVFEQIGLDDKPTVFLGADLMSGRRVILDYANAALYLKP